MVSVPEALVMPTQNFVADGTRSTLKWRLPLPFLFVVMTPVTGLGVQSAPVLWSTNTPMYSVFGAACLSAISPLTVASLPGVFRTANPNVLGVGNTPASHENAFAASGPYSGAFCAPSGASARAELAPSADSGSARANGRKSALIDASVP